MISSGTIRSTCTQELSPHFLDRAPGFGYIAYRCLCGQVYRLGDGIVRIFLEGGLNAHMLLGGDVKGGAEQLLQILGQASDILYAAPPGQLRFEIRGINPPFHRHLLKER